MKPIYQLSKQEVIEKLHTSEFGLRNVTIPALRAQYGENELQEAKQKNKFSILLAQFADVMILILVIAAIISFVVGEHTDAIVILAIIVANAWMGYAQESKAEESIRMLKKLAAQSATVLRDHHPVRIEASQLVPGDVILIEAGDIVPADARLIEVHALKTDESSLTGESHSVEKIIEPIPQADLVPGDQLNMVFRGTIVSNGSGKAVVTATGMNTELGKIAGLLDEGSPKTPLQKRLARFSKQLVVIIIIICALVFVFGMWRGEPAFLMFLTALSLAVAALPEALPAVITIALARGANRLVRQKALIRNLPAVETLGSVTYICTDKTGTLTLNEMTVEKVQVEKGMEELLKYAMLVNNEVKFDSNGALLGDSTEKALVHCAIKSGHTKKEADERFPLWNKLPFDSVRMRMSTLHRDGNDWKLFVKGAPAKMIERLAEKYKDRIPEWLELNRTWAKEGLRVLFFAYRKFKENPAKVDESLESNLDFLGITAMIDPPREEVIEAIHQCNTAGIKTVMITGDQALTAQAIAERLHIVDDGTREIRTSSDLEKMSEEEFVQEVKNIYVYARVTPEQKLRIVKALQSNEEFVAMTGDGVNDAPALKQADIGVAMGVTGTDVAKESADMILLDDNFTTIVKAVREGRRIYENIRKFILYILSCNLSEILLIFLAPILGFAIPLLPTHILWINLVTDGLPGIALVSEPAEKDIMNHPPRSPKESLFAGGLSQKIISSAIVMTLSCFIVLWWADSHAYEIRTQQSMVFTTLCFVQLGNALSSRSFYHSLFSIGSFFNRTMWGTIALTVMLQLSIVYLPYLQKIFKTAHLGLSAMTLVIMVTLGSLLSIEALKYLGRRNYTNQETNSPPE